MDFSIRVVKGRWHYAFAVKGEAGERKTLNVTAPLTKCAVEVDNVVRMLKIASANGVRYNALRQMRDLAI